MVVNDVAVLITTVQLYFHFTTGEAILVLMIETLTFVFQRLQIDKPVPNSCC